MKRIAVLAVAAVSLSAGAAYAAAPESVMAAVMACCDLVKGCC